MVMVVDEAMLLLLSYRLLRAPSVGLGVTDWDVNEREGRAAGCKGTEQHYTAR
jgi:hypothetical protein